MKLIAVKTKSNVFISDNIEPRGYFNSSIMSYIFDGVKAVSTYKPDWFSVPDVPKKVEKQTPDKRVNIRWELKEGYPETPITPKVLHESPNDDDSEYYEVKGLYEMKYETEPGGLEIVEFEVSIIAEDDNFKIIKQDFPVSNSIIDQLTFHPVLLSTKPCKLSSEEFYSIVRKHVKANIDPMYARITSDYDFCFTVKKVLELYKPEAYKVDVGTKRRPNIVVRYNQKKEITVYETAPKPYSGYTTIQPLIGESYEDLQSKLNEYLSEIMTKINQPIKECGTCCGTGVVLI